MEEEDDLEALRLAALQTIKPKKYQNVYRPKDHIPYYRPLTNPNLIAIVPKEEPFFTPPPESPPVEVHKKVEVKEKSPESDENVEEEKTIRSKFRRDSENEIVKLDEDQLDFECEGESDLLELHNDDSLEKLMDEMEQEFNDDSPRAKNGTTKRDKRKPSPKVEEPKRSLTPKEKLSPYYDKRRSPSPRRRSPIQRRSRSPWLKRSNSPRRRSPSPRKRSITPRRRSFSPRKRSLTPRKRSISPKRRSRSPRYRRSPIRRSSISPRFRRRTPSPRRSPIRRRSPSLSPRRSPRRSPVRLKRLSPRRKLSPRRSLSPRSSRRRPSPLYRSPRRSLSPRKRISPRRKRSRSPLPKPRRSPEKRRPNLPKEEKKSEEKEEVVDPKLEARRKKFESNSVVAPTQKKIRLKTTQEEEEEEKPQNNHTETNEEETDLNINENPLLLRILNRKKIDLDEGSLDIKDLVNRLNKADKVKTEKKSKRRPVLINQIEDAISEEPKILEKAKRKKAKVAPILFSEGAKLKKKKVEKVIEIEDDVVEVSTQVKIKEKADEGTDLRAELSRRRAERLKETKFQPAMRIIQSAIEGAVIGNRKRLQKPDEIAKKMSLQGRRVRVVDPDNVPENDSEEEGEEDEEDFNSIGSYGTLRMTTIRSGKRFK